MIEQIAIYGAGGFGREVAMLIGQINAAGKRYNLAGYFDDQIPPGTMLNDIPVLGE